MNFARFLKYWMPVFVWLGVIFVGSTDLMSAEQTSRFLVPFLRWLKPDISPETIAQIHFLFRKLGHISEYAILAMLFWRAVYRGTNLEMKMSPDPAKAGGSFDTKTVAGHIVQTEGAGRPILLDSIGCQWVRSRSILFLSVWMVCAIFAAMDEFHQSFVASRTAAPGDVLIDSGGAIAGLIICAVFAVRKRG
jgi:VanZ family protein